MSNALRQSSGVFLVVAACLVKAACNPFDPDLEYKVGGVDSVGVKSVVSPNEDLPVRLMGSRGACDQLRLTVTKNSSELAITPMLSHPREGTCTLQLIFVDTTIIARAPHANPLTIRLRRYNTTDLLRTVEVK
ncbi:MAG TPA: hypothetical protein VM100_10465 [Longimicrobiales bacterium]|nr:hypothetical protein [Longimicrobiales bacterium]